MDISAVSTFCQFGVMLLLQTLRYFSVGCCCCSLVSDSLSGCMFSSVLGIRLRLQVLGHVVTLCDLITVLSLTSKADLPLCVTTSDTTGVPVSQSHTCHHWLLWYNCLVGLQQYLTVLLIFISLMADDAEHLFLCLLAFRKTFIQFFCLFLIIIHLFKLSLLLSCNHLVHFFPLTWHQPDSFRELWSLFSRNGVQRPPPQFLRFAPNWPRASFFKRKHALSLFWKFQFTRPLEF